ncbi:hypothetical protein D3C76_754890 [compost metagenome]
MEQQGIELQGAELGCGAEQRSRGLAEHEVLASHVMTTLLRGHRNANGVASTPDTLDGFGYPYQYICVFLGKHSTSLCEEMLLKSA